METKEYFEKEMFFESLPSIVFTPPSVPLVGDRKRVCHKSMAHPFRFFSFFQIRN